MVTDTNQCILNIYESYQKHIFIEFIVVQRIIMHSIFY